MNLINEKVLGKWSCGGVGLGSRKLQPLSSPIATGTFISSIIITTYYCYYQHHSKERPWPLALAAGQVSRGLHWPLLL